jgi:glycosyltransferase involved in cell wall biosynthesis
MKILLIGHRQDIFARELGGELEAKGHQTFFLDSASLEVLRKNSIVNTSYAKRFGRYRNIPKINVLFKFYFIYRAIAENSFDVVNVLSAGWQYLLLLRYIKKASSRFVITFYGSDFYRTSNNIKKMQMPLYRAVDALTFTNPTTKESFLNHYGYFNEKSFVCRFGLKTLDFIDSNRNKECTVMKSHLGYDPDKIIITCGYNATAAQQHEAIIENIQALEEELLKKVQFVFLLTYGDREYGSRIKQLLKKSAFDYIVLEDFLYDDDNAYTKLASDIMINILETDSFSGSMQEFLYAGNIVITGEWLPYGLFDENGIQYEKIAKPEELCDKMAYCIRHMDEMKKDLGNNRKIIGNLSSWSRNIQSWIDVYSFSKK